MRDILLSDTCVLLDFCEIGELSTLLHFRDRIVIAEDLLIAELPTWEASQNWSHKRYCPKSKPAIF